MQVWDEEDLSLAPRARPPAPWVVGPCPEAQACACTLQEGGGWRGACGLALALTRWRAFNILSLPASGSPCHRASGVPGCTPALVFTLRLNQGALPSLCGLEQPHSLRLLWSRDQTQGAWPGRSCCGKVPKLGRRGAAQQCASLGMVLGCREAQPL